MRVEAIKAEIVQKVFELLFVSRDMDRVNAYLAEHLDRVTPYSAFAVFMSRPEPPSLTVYPHDDVGPAFLAELQEKVYASLRRWGGAVEEGAVQVRMLGRGAAARRRRAKLQSFVNIPIFQDEDLVGALSIASTQKDVYVTTDLSFFSNIAELLGRTYATLRQEVAEREGELARLREMDRQKDKFLSAVSHELRSPLTVLSGLLEILREGQAGPVSEQQYEFLSSALEQATRLRWLMENLLDLSKMEYGTLDLSRQPARLDHLLERAIRSLRYELERKNLQIDLDKRIRTLPPVCADPNRLIQVLVNLMDNATKFTPPGGRVHVTARSLAPRESAVEVSIADTGRGIPEEDQPHVFDRFYRLGRDIRGAAGTGLGLSIAKEIIETQQGRIWVESREGEGSTFSFTLPIYQPAASLRAYLEQVVRHAREIETPLSFVLLSFEGHLSDEAEEVVGTILRSSESVFHYAAGQGVLVLGSFVDVADAQRMAERIEARLEEHLSRPTLPHPQVRTRCLSAVQDRRRSAAEDGVIEDVVRAVAELARGPALDTASSEGGERRASTRGI